MTFVLFVFLPEVIISKLLIASNCGPCSLHPTPTPTPVLLQRDVHFLLSSWLRFGDTIKQEKKPQAFSLLHN